MSSPLTPASSLKPVWLAGLPLSALSLREAVDHIVGLAVARQAADVHLVNAYTVSLADTRPEVRDVLLAARLNLADGRPLTWASRWLSAHRLEQVRGPDLFERVIAHDQKGRLKHYLLGGTQETLDKLVESLKARYPDASIVGAMSPPFRHLEEREIAAQDTAIRASGANLVWVGLGTPKQDLEAARLAASLGIPAVAVGAAFDFSAGALRRAPRWVSWAGMEWLFRLAMEPRRLWRRYTVGNWIFVGALIRRRPQGQRP